MIDSTLYIYIDYKRVPREYHDCSVRDFSGGAYGGGGFSGGGFSYFLEREPLHALGQCVHAVELSMSLLGMQQPGTSRHYTLPV